MYHILFGFDDETVVKAIIRTIKQQSGLKEIKYSMQTTKDAVEEYIKYQPDCNTIILREVMDNENWTAEELSSLNDKKTFNILVIIDAKYKGTEFVKTLYTAGITNAFLVEVNKGIQPAEIAHFVLHPRNRESARKVYGITTTKNSIDILTSDVYLKKYAYLMDDTQGINIIDRYLIIIKDFSIKTGADFTRKLPPNIINKLCRYEEFWKVYDKFITSGQKMNIRRPKQLIKGMSDEDYKKLVTGKGQPKRKAVKIPEEYRPEAFKEEIPQQPMVSEKAQASEEDDYFNDMMSLFEDVAVPPVKEEAPVAVEPKESIEFSKDTTLHKAEPPKVIKEPNQVKKEVVVNKNNSNKKVSPSVKTVKPNVKVVSESKSVLNEETYSKGKKKRERKKTRIKWGLVLGILAASVLVLISFYFLMMMRLL